MKEINRKVSQHRTLEERAEQFDGKLGPYEGYDWGEPVGQEVIKMKDDNCIFCKLANGDIPTMSLYEDEDFNVIFDAGPATAGHALILPKEHFRNIFEIDEEVQAKAYKLAKKMAPVLTEVFEADGLNVLQNNNEAAGQTVFHYHIHLIPRYKDDKSMVAWTPGEQDKEKLEKALEEIRKRLA